MQTKGMGDQNIKHGPFRKRVHSDNWWHEAEVSNLNPSELADKESIYSAAFNKFGVALKTNARERYLAKLSTLNQASRDDSRTLSAIKTLSFIAALDSADEATKTNIQQFIDSQLAGAF